MTTVILMVSFLLLRSLIQLDHPWVYYVFYAWVSIYGILATSQFWLFANEIFNPAQAKRLFPLLNLGGIIGATIGGEVTSLVVRVFEVRTENLLFFCVGFLAICILLVNLTWTAKQKEGEVQATRAPMGEEHGETIGQLFGTIRRSRQLMLIVGIISMTMMIASFVDFQFKALVEWMEENLVEGFMVYRFPRSAHRRIRTINCVENLNREIRRRTRVVGIFPNEASAMRLISAVLEEIHEEWLTFRKNHARYSGGGKHGWAEHLSLQDSGETR